MTLGAPDTARDGPARHRPALPYLRGCCGRPGPHITQDWTLGPREGCPGLLTSPSRPEPRVLLQPITHISDVRHRTRRTHRNRNLRGGQVTVLHHVGGHLNDPVSV